MFSAEETESLSVTVICVDIRESEAPPALVRPDRFPSLSVNYKTSEFVLIYAKILFDFHCVQRKLYSFHSSKSPIDHQNRVFNAFLTSNELFPRPI